MVNGLIMNVKKLCWKGGKLGLTWGVENWLKMVLLRFPAKVDIKHTKHLIQKL